MSYGNTTEQLLTGRDKNSGQGMIKFYKQKQFPKQMRIKSGDNLQPNTRLLAKKKRTEKSKNLIRSSHNDIFKFNVMKECKVMITFYFRTGPKLLNEIRTIKKHFLFNHLETSI